MMRFVIVLGVALMIVVMAWPYLRRYMPRRQPGAPKRPSKGELIWFALLATVALSFGISTMLWVFGR
jgi:heme/copper-type cytochrome/quinol oxidase subunit 2